MLVENKNDQIIFEHLLSTNNFDWVTLNNRFEAIYDCYVKSDLLS